MVNTRVYRSYPWFTVYMAAASLQVLVWFTGGPSTHSYVVAWASTMAVQASRPAIR